MCFVINLKYAQKSFHFSYSPPIAYKLFAKVELKDMEACLSSFELNNRNTIAENNANPRYDNKNAYIIEEFKRVSKNKLQRERLVDRYYRSYIDEKGFATECIHLFRLFFL